MMPGEYLGLRLLNEYIKDEWVDIYEKKLSCFLFNKHLNNLMNYLYTQLGMLWLTLKLNVIKMQNVDVDAVSAVELYRAAVKHT